MRRVLLPLFLSFFLEAPAVAQKGLREIVIGPRDEAAKKLLSRDARKYPLVPWDEKTAAHLIRRAGFSASPAEIDRIVKQGFVATLDQLLKYEDVDDSAMLTALAAKNYQFVTTNSAGTKYAKVDDMQRSWLYRMVNGKHQLVEKMTYFWHDHFATSVSQVNLVDSTNRPLMVIQNELLRGYALGNFKELVEQVARDPAMLYWLDNRLNVRGKPNENWARELMELFTMGVDGGYTEQDIKEAARAFTGWGIDRPTQGFRFYPTQHDDGQKTFLGVTGNLDGGDVINIIFQQKVTAEFIAKKLFEFFVYPDPPRHLITELGNVFRDSGYDTGTLMRAIFEHPEFYADKAYRAHIKSPVELVVSIYREFGISDPVNLPRYMSTMNQSLYAPPDVSGWVSGVGWMNTATVLSRYNFLNWIATRRSGTDMLDVNRIIQAAGLKTSQDVASYFLKTLVVNDASADTYYALEEYLRKDDSGKLVEFNISDSTTVDKKVRGLIYLVSILPEYQLN